MNLFLIASVFLQTRILLFPFGATMATVNEFHHMIAFYLLVSCNSQISDSAVSMKSNEISAIHLIDLCINDL